MANALKTAVQGAARQSVDLAALWAEFKKIADSGSRDYRSLDAQIALLSPEEKAIFQQAATTYDSASQYRGEHNAGWKANAEKIMAPALQARSAQQGQTNAKRLAADEQKLSAAEQEAAAKIEPKYEHVAGTLGLTNRAAIEAAIANNQAYDDLSSATQRVNQNYQGLAQRQAELSGAYNATDQNLWNTLNAQYADLNASDLGALQNYQNQIAPLQTAMKAGGYTGIENDAQGLGLQQQSYNTFNNIYGGGLDISPDAYGAGLQNQSLGQFQDIYRGGLDISADPESLWQQQQALANFHNVYGGGLNINPDDQGLYMQEESYRLGRRIASGELDYSSQGAQAYADEGAIQRQHDILAQLRGASRGDLNTTSQAARAYADDGAAQQHQRALDQLSGVQNGSMDVESQAAKAFADPESIDAQKYALGKYREGIDPTVSAQERFIMETFRRQAEQQLRSRQDAVMSDLSARGMGGSGAELANMLGTQQLIGEQGVLAELGAQANAVGRAERMLGGYADTASNIRQQSFGEAFNRGSAADATAHANKDRALQGLALYTDQTGKLRSATFDEAYKRGLAGDQTAMANANRMLEAAGMSGALATDLRNASFNEAYQRGIAADAASANNQQARIQGGNLAAGQANAIRTANDAVAMANQRTQLGGAEAYGNQANAMREAADWISAQNQSTRMQGATQYGNQANAIRTANDWVNAQNQATRLGGAQGMSTDAYRIRELNEATTQFNKSQEMMQQRQQENYAQAEAERLAGLANTSLGNTLGVNQGVANRGLTTFNAGQQTTQQQYGRDQDSLKANAAAADVDYDTATKLAEALSSKGQTNFANLNALTGTASGVADTYAGGITGTLNLSQGATKRGLMRTGSDEQLRILGL